jgi:hypothetical protein
MKRKRLWVTMVAAMMVLAWGLTSFAASGSGKYGSVTVTGNATLRSKSVYGNTSVTGRTATLRIRASRRPTDGNQYVVTLSV